MFLKEDILYEDNHFIVVNKQNGKLVQGDSTGDLPLENDIKSYLKIRDRKPGGVFLGVVHRLDRPVSGAVIFAKTSKGLRRFNDLLKERKVTKKYWAIVLEAPQQMEDTLTHYMTRNTTLNKSTAHNNSVKESKKAILKYKIIASSKNYRLLEIDLVTGRHHQIRAQLSKIGLPIKGDLKYGAPQPNKDAGISLHARSLEFIQPISLELIKIVAPTPKNDSLWEYFEKAAE